MTKKRVLTNADYFKVYHAENPHVYIAFKAYALQLIAAGVENISAYLIYERMRYESLINGKGSYKINNNYRPYYARLFMQDFPEYEGIFCIRSTAQERA